MTLPVKNSNRRNIGLYAVLCILSVITVFFAGCTEEPKAPTLDGNVAKPSWKAPEATDFSSSMTAVINVSLLEQYPSMAVGWELKETDLLGAFVDDVCVGVTWPNEGLFYLYVAGLSADGQEQSINGKPISLRYYSTHFKNLFEAKDVFEFKNDDHLGTIAEPLVPKFQVVK